MLDQSSKCSRVPFGTLKYVPMSAGNGPIGWPLRLWTAWWKPFHCPIPSPVFYVHEHVIMWSCKKACCAYPLVISFLLTQFNGICYLNNRYMLFLWLYFYWKTYENIFHWPMVLFGDYFSQLLGKRLQQEQNNDWLPWTIFTLRSVIFLILSNYNSSFSNK
jgi:hypothetical protein